MWTRQAREAIAARLSSLLPPEAHENLIGIGSIIDELAKNAIKANHKFLILRRKILEHYTASGLSKAEAENRRDETTSNAAALNEFVSAHPHVMEGTVAELRTILNQESIWLQIKNRFRKDKRRVLTPEDRAKLASTADFRRNFHEIRKRRVYVEFRASTSAGQLWVELINAAPILETDLMRIYKKRGEFKEHREKGTEWEFFLNHMDTSDGGSGLGYATIDSILAQLGFDPESALVILSLHNTNVMLHLDIEVLSKPALVPGR